MWVFQGHAHLWTVKILNLYMYKNLVTHIDEICFKCNVLLKCLPGI